MVQSVPFTLTSRRVASVTLQPSVAAATESGHHDPLVGCCVRWRSRLPIPLVGIQWQRLECDDGVDNELDVVLDASSGQ